MRAELSGQLFGRLTVIEFSEVKTKRAVWKCQCSCGNITYVPTHKLKSGHTQSCGCLHKEKFNCGHPKHGMWNTGTYRTWYAMVYRCTKSNHHRYEDYGGRGITVCDEWLEFENFIRDMGVRPDNRTLERNDNNKGYNKENCCWSTITEQGANKRNNQIITHNGETLTYSQWADKLGVDMRLIWQRIHKLEWDPAKAITTPFKKLKRLPKETH